MFGIRGRSKKYKVKSGTSTKSDFKLTSSPLVWKVITEYYLLYMWFYLYDEVSIRSIFSSPFQTFGLF